MIIFREFSLELVMQVKLLISFCCIRVKFTFVAANVVNTLEMIYFEKLSLKLVIIN